jgi:16S rRNA (guanine1516-N2)-methyltransferase
MHATIKNRHASIAVNGVGACSFLNDFVQAQEDKIAVNSDLNTQADLELCSSDIGLQLAWYRGDEKPLKFHLDFVKTAQQLRSFPAPKQGAFNQSLGKKTKNVIDATGGWGGDSLLMSLQGYQVTLVERLPIMATLLAEAFNRLATSSWARQNQFTVPKVLCGNALNVLQEDSLEADCVYLDPMFPPKRKKSAATNKHMQLLQWLAGPDDDASELAAYAVKKYSRLAVKRPDYAQPLLPNPSVQFSSKLVHYDVYL